MPNLDVGDNILPEVGDTNVPKTPRRTGYEIESVVIPRECYDPLNLSNNCPKCGHKLLNSEVFGTLCGYCGHYSDVKNKVIKE